MTSALYNTPGRAPRGRPMQLPRSADAVLVAAVRARIGCKLHQLAERMGLAAAPLLSRANTKPLPPQRRAELGRMLTTLEEQPMLTDLEQALLRELAANNTLPASTLSWRVLEAEGLVTAAATLTPVGRAWVAANPRTPQ